MNRFQRKGAKSNKQVGDDFQEKIRVYWKDTHGINLRFRFVMHIGVGDLKKPHEFDLGCCQRKIVVECKSHDWTSGDNVPSAKLADWNQAMFYFSMCPDEYRKYFFCERFWSEKRGCTLAEYYRDKYYHMIPEGVEIWEYDKENHTATQVQLHTSQPAVTSVLNS